MQTISHKSSLSPNGVDLLKEVLTEARLSKNKPTEGRSATIWWKPKTGNTVDAVHELEQAELTSEPYIHTDKIVEFMFLGWWHVTVLPPHVTH